MNHLNVIFGGTCRNVSQYIAKNLDNINNAGSKFNSFVLIIYENDSNDGTRNILLNRKQQNYIYLFEDNVMEKRRTMRLQNGRNKILQEMKKMNHKNQYTYFIMLDMDETTVGGSFVNTLDTCFVKYPLETWDVLTGNQCNLYYDLWALRKSGVIDYDCWRHDGSKTEEVNHLLSSLKFTVRDELIPVDSAFGGIAVYKISSIENCVYVGEYKDGSEKCEHVEFHKSIRENGGKIFINSHFLTDAPILKRIFYPKRLQRGHFLRQLKF
jgi:hypothetical protein